jgi:Glyoxalase-like domain
LVALGAREGETITEYDVTWTVMTDPEDNEFCVVAEKA